ncbi:MAG: DUF4010 domain-containing protein [Candidatus Roizmanbacteria bacterium]|nr:DUF4010 domain-containing protein [Candidatus Roizmanbacteria bacterium]
MELNAALKLVIALAVGAAIGLEREIHQKKDHHKNRSGALIGVRTFALTTLLGSIAGLLNDDQFVFSSIISATFLILITINYAISSYISRDTGITTELAAVISYVIGFLIAINFLPMPLVLSIAVVLMLILAYKDQVKSVVEELHVRELKALLSYAIIAIVILPFLPNTSITLENLPLVGPFLRSYGFNFHLWQSLEIINPFKTWLIVAIITGVDLVGYILGKMFGKGNGFIISSLIGGFVSSTATTQALAVKSKRTKNLKPLLAASCMATATSFISLFLVIMPLNPSFTITILPTLSLLLISFGIVSVIFLPVNLGRSEGAIHHSQNQAIFSIKPALLFAVLFISIKIISSVALILFGSRGFLVTAALAGTTGLDAVMVNIADLSKNAITLKTAILAFLIVNAVNLGAKTFYIFLQGTREFAVKYGVIVGTIIVLSFAGLWFV